MLQVNGYPTDVETPLDAELREIEMLVAQARTEAERHEGKRLTEMGPPASVFIGPEGGFSPAEVEAAERAGLAIAGLGPRILRSESVAVAVAAAILSRTGDFA